MTIKFKTEKNPDGTTKIFGPGVNTAGEKFEGTTDGPFYVACVNGQPIETVIDGKTLKSEKDIPENCFLTFGGTEDECNAFATR